jgi:hypothetical protein
VNSPKRKQRSQNKSPRKVQRKRLPLNLVKARKRIMRKAPKVINPAEIFGKH